MPSHEDRGESATVRLPQPLEMFSARDERMETNGILKGELQTPVVRIDYPEEGGVLVWMRGDKYPTKLMVFREAIFAADSIKRVVISAARFLSGSPTRYLVAPFLILPKKMRKRMIDQAISCFSGYAETIFNRWGRIMVFEDDKGVQFGIGSVVRDPKYYCDMVREFRRVAMPMAGDDASRRTLVEAICMILEFDDAYRYRLQDGFGEIDGDAARKDPFRELARIFTIIRDRGHGTSEKFDSFLRVMPLLRSVPGLEGILKDFFSKADLRKMSLDKIDFYRCMLWGGHSFKGISDSDRASMRIMIDSQWTHEQGLKNKR